MSNEQLSNSPSQAIVDVLNERQRQIDKKGFSSAKDDLYEQNELVRAGASYVNHVVGRSWCFEEFPENYRNEDVSDFWPWPVTFWKPKSPREDLVRAAALLIAEIERIDRKEIANE